MTIIAPRPSGAESSTLPRRGGRPTRVVYSAVICFALFTGVEALHSQARFVKPLPMTGGKHVQVSTVHAPVIIGVPDGFVSVDPTEFGVPFSGGSKSRPLAFFIRPDDIERWRFADAESLQHAVASIFLPADHNGITTEEFDQLKAAARTAAGRAAAAQAREEAVQAAKENGSNVPREVTPVRVLFESDRVLAHTAVFSYGRAEETIRVVSAMAYVRVAGTMLYMTCFGTDPSGTEKSLLNWVNRTLAANPPSRPQQ